MYSKNLHDLVELAKNIEDLNAFAKTNRQIGKQLTEETSFLNKGYMRERLWYVENNTNIVPTCKCCSKSVKWNNLDRKFQPYCSVKCSKNDPDQIAAYQATCLEKYGTLHPWSNKDVREKYHNTMIENHGVSNPAQSAVLLEKRNQSNIDNYGQKSTATLDWVLAKKKETMLERYGVEHQSECVLTQQKTIETNRSKYGTDYVLQNADVIQKRKNTNLENIGFENQFSSPAIQQQIKETNLERYGAEKIGQSAIIRQKIESTNLCRYNQKSTANLPHVVAKRLLTMVERHGVPHAMQNDSIRQHAVAKSLPARLRYRCAKYGTRSCMLRNDIQYLTNAHHTDKKSLTRIAKDIGASQPTMSHLFKKFNIEVLKAAHSGAEQELYEYLTQIISNDIIQHDYTIVAPFELDILIPEKKLAIEFNGVVWHSELRGKHKQYHLHKTITCNNAGYTLLHINDIEWKTQSDIVKSRISAKLGLSTRIFARKTNIKLLSSTEQMLFFQDNHIQGGTGCAVAYGLFLDDQLVSAMSFGSTNSRFNKNYQYELIRFAHMKYHTVIGGANKLFNHFIKTHEPQSIISYSDRRWNTGEIYGKMGFTFVKNSEPNYWYFYAKRSYKLFHRVNFQKHKLADKLENFNPNLTEWQNMQNNGYDRIWDCGNSVWSWYSEKI